jgi:RHS repeat-associated protein
VAEALVGLEVALEPAHCTDDLGRTEQTIDPNENTRGTTYNTDGYVSGLMSGLNIPTAFTYSTDGDDNVTQIQDGSTGSSLITTKLQYPASGSGQGPNQYLPNVSTDPQGNQQTYGYDSNGNVQTSTDQLSSQNSSTVAYDETPGVSSGEYDGQVSSSTDADQHTTTYGYTKGNLTSIVAPAGSGLNLTALSYDSANRVTKLSTVANGTGHEVDYTYDKFDRITQEVYKNASDANTETLSYTYDPDGNLKTSTDSQGTTTYTYDELNRITGESFPNGSTDSYGYDQASNLTTLTDAGGTVTYGYDHANQLTSVTDPGASTPTTMTYDADGNLLTTTYPSGVAIARTYNPEDQLTTVTDTYAGGGNLGFDYGYNGELRASSGMGTGAGTKNPYAYVTTYSYDQLNRLTEASSGNTHPQTGVLQEYIYALDGAGNITSVSQGPPNSLTTTSYTYNPANEIATGSGHSYTYDSDGNQTSNGSGLTTAYNPSQQTTSITEAGTTTPYAYFGTGQNQIATEGSNALHDDILGLASHQNAGSTAYFTRSIDGEQIDERTSSGTYNYLYDGNGSVIGLTNSQGQLVNQYAYDPYGNRTSSSGTAPDYFGFQGGYLTPSGLYHFGARYYNPADGRWTQEDPLLHIGDLTQNDRYVFAGDDPVNGHGSDR